MCDFATRWNLKLIHVIESAGAQGNTRKKARPPKGNPILFSQWRSLVPAEAVEVFDIQVEVIESADAAEAIAQEAESFRADAICLASHGRSGLAKHFLGRSPRV